MHFLIKNLIIGMIMGIALIIELICGVALMISNVYKFTSFIGLILMFASAASFLITYHIFPKPYKAYLFLGFIVGIIIGLGLMVTGILHQGMVL